MAPLPDPAPPANETAAAVSHLLARLGYEHAPTDPPGDSVFSFTITAPPEAPFLKIVLYQIHPESPLSIDGCALTYKAAGTRSSLSDAAFPLLKAAPREPLERFGVSMGGGTDGSFPWGLGTGMDLEDLTMDALGARLRGLTEACRIAAERLATEFGASTPPLLPRRWTRVPL